MIATSALPSSAVLGALFSFMAVAAITPGPNNLMLATSGVNFGIRRTVPHMVGIWLGCMSVLLAAGFGLGELFSAFSPLRVAVQVAGAAYMLWLAWKIATAGSFGSGDAAHAHPFRLPAAIAFQWVNPKLWVVSITAMALYVRPGHAMGDVVLVTAVNAIVNIPCMLIWTGFGAALRDFMKVPGRMRIFNIVMGVLLALSVLALLER